MLQDKLNTGFEKYLKYNASVYFLLRPITNTTLAEHHKAGFINSYLYYEGKESFYCVYKENEYYPELLFSFRNNTNFVQEFSCNNNSIIEWKIPDEYSKDYQIFKQGKYSSFSNFFKTQFEKKLSTGAKSLQWKIFDKDEELKKMIENYVGCKLDNDTDYFFIPQIKKETYECSTTNT